MAALMACAKAGAQGRDLADRPELSELGPLLASAREHGCLSVVAAPLLSLPGLPPELTALLDRALARAWAAHEVTAANLGPILRQAAEVGIRVVVYKGAAQAARYYAKPWVRPMADVDLLVGKDDDARLATLLAAHGFRRRSTPGRAVTESLGGYEHSYVAPTPGARVLDVHTAPTQPARYRLPVDEMIERARPGTMFGAPVRFLIPEDELLVMAVNQAYDHFRMGFLRHLDAWLISQHANVDWSALARAARAVGAATATWLTLSTAHRLADVPVDAGALAAIEPSRSRRAWLRALLDDDHSGEPRWSLPRRIEQLLLLYPVMDGPAGFARFVAHHGALRVLDAADQLIHRVRRRDRPQP